MSEKLKPLADEQTEPEASQAEKSVLPAETDSEETADIADDSTVEQLEEEEDIDPADARIFGLPRIGFHCTAFGVAAGYIVCGLIGLAGFTPPNATICAVVCAAIGYFIGNRLYKKQKAERDAAKQSQESAE